MRSRPIGYYTKGRGPNRKVHPITESRKSRYSGRRGSSEEIRRPLGHSYSELKSYKVILEYEDGKTETIYVKAKNREDALNRAFRQRKNGAKPKKASLSEHFSYVLRILRPKEEPQEREDEPIPKWSLASESKQYDPELGYVPKWSYAYKGEQP